MQHVETEVASMDQDILHIKLNMHVAQTNYIVLHMNLPTLI